jgi:hypothetical protein
MRCARQQIPHSKDPAERGPGKKAVEMRGLAYALQKIICIGINMRTL